MEYNSEAVEEISKNNKVLTRRLMEMEYIFHKVAKNATAQQDALNDIETRTKALDLTEQRLNREITRVMDARDEVSWKFKMMKQDREAIEKRMMDTDNAV